jgi:hypothetical protein
MRVQEAKRTQKVLDDLLKVHKYMKAEKPKQALKSLESLVGKLKKKLDKKATKKPATGFSLFVKNNFKKVAKENPKASASEIMKLLGTLYRSSGAKKAAPVKAAKKADKPKAAKKSAADKKKPKAPKKPAAKKAPKK